MIYFYIAGIVIWPLIWWFIGGFKISKEKYIFFLPFSLCMAVLLLNAILVFHHGPPSTVHVEEDLFRFLDSRASNIISVISGILVIAAVTYSVADRKMPVFFLRFITATYIALIGFMTPIIWIPTDEIEWLRILRAFQTLPFTYGIFFAITAILILLQDILHWMTHEVNKAGNS